MFKCNFCQSKFGTVQKYSLHQHFHRRSCKQFRCLYPECNVVFQKYSAFKSHIFRCHETDKITKVIPTVSKAGLTCNVDHCIFLENDVGLYKRHFYDHLRKGKAVKCPFECDNKRQFFNTRTLRSHFCRNHPNSVLDKFFDAVDSSEPSSGSHFTTGTNSSFDLDANQAQDKDLVDNNSGGDVTRDVKSLGMHLFSNLYLTLETKYLLSKFSVQFLISAISDIGKLNLDYIYQMLKANGHNVNPETIEKDLFYLANNTESGIFKSNFVREVYFKDNLNFVPPLKVCLQYETHQTFFYYVSIIETIKQLSKNKHIFNRLIQEEKSDVRLYQDITDGNCYRNNVFFQTNKFGLKIILFQDAFEICNPLGSAKKVYKIVAIYMALANIEPWLRMKIDHIQLVALFFEKDLKNFNFNEFLKPLVDDLKIIENDGIKIEKNVNILGTLVALVGDNLGSHQIGGFLESFQTNKYFCRYCYENEFQAETFWTLSEYRNKCLHNVDVSFSSSLNEPCKGVKSKSILNDLKYFHVCNPGLPPCIAHDIFEGVAQYDLMLIIKKLISDKVINFESLNLKMINVKMIDISDNQNFPEIKSKEKMTGTASQMIHIINILPFALYDLHQDLADSPTWELFLIFRKICGLIMGLKLSVDQIAILQNLLFEYMNLRIKIFPSSSLKPKHHYMLHYPYLINQFGPLRHLWTLRFESKHGYFKKVLRHCPNFKNVLFSLANKHQLLQTLEVFQGESYASSVICKEVNVCLLSDYPESITSILKNEMSFSDKPVFISSSLTFRGIAYSKGKHICTRKTEYGLYEICKIDSIFINNEFDDIAFVGYTFPVFYNAQSGLLEKASEENDLAKVCIVYKNIINIEPLFHSLVQNRHVYYFKSAPFETF